MTVTEVHIYGTPRPGFLGYASIVLAGAVKLKHIRIVPPRNAGEPVVVLMPSKRKDDGTYTEYYHPIKAESRALIEGAVRAEWLRKHNAQSPD